MSAFEVKMAAVSVDRARGATRDDPTCTPDAWRALVDGEWALVEIFDSDGRRFMIARRAPPASFHAPLLSEREQCVLGLRARAQGIKQIAYDLALSESTVSRILSVGMRKLGLSTASELTRFDTSK
jgi:DNA-binding NarL/FixJ family response regulator